MDDVTGKQINFSAVQWRIKENSKSRTVLQNETLAISSSVYIDQMSAVAFVSFLMGVNVLYRDKTEPDSRWMKLWLCADHLTQDLAAFTLITQAAGTHARSQQVSSHKFREQVRKDVVTWMLSHGRISNTFLKGLQRLFATTGSDQWCYCIDAKLCE